MKTSKTKRAKESDAQYKMKIARRKLGFKDSDKLVAGDLIKKARTSVAGVTNSKKTLAVKGLI